MSPVTSDEELLLIQALNVYRLANEPELDAAFYYALLIARGADEQNVAIKGGLALMQEAAQKTLDTVDATIAAQKQAAENLLARTAQLTSAVAIVVSSGAKGTV